METLREMRHKNHAGWEHGLDDMGRKKSQPLFHKSKSGIQRPLLTAVYDP
jgi:hypothetical protein